MFWADDTINSIKETYAQKIRAGQTLVVRDEKTASGRVHVGSLRGVVIHGVVSEILKEQNVPHTYRFEINDFDPMDGIPTYLDQAYYTPYLGKPLCNVPSPDGIAKNFAEYYAEEFTGVINELGYHVEFYRSSDMYRSGAYNDAILVALTHADKIREIYQRVSGSVRGEDWVPVQVVCENCGKVSTTKVTSFDGKKVTYTCVDIEWTMGCAHTGIISPFNGGAKLPWKVEWAAKFKIMNVDIEGGGKDHSTKGGSRQVADAIAREVFATEPPFNIPYEFFHVKGRKMSSSKGAGTSSREMADLLPPHMLRLLMLQKPPQRVLDFAPDGDTVPILYDVYDRLAETYFEAGGEGEARLFTLIHRTQDAPLLKKRFLPRFSQVAYLVQMPHIDIFKEVEKEKGSPLTTEDCAEIELRKTYATRWLDLYAPEDYKFDIKKTVPGQVKDFTAEQKAVLAQILEYIRSKDVLDGQELHTQLHEIRKASPVEPKAFFEALYLSFLGKSSGPKAGWFFSVLDKKFVEQRLSEVLGNL
jgi:lysyl-tRNA synthetase, class I